MKNLKHIGDGKVIKGYLKKHKIVVACVLAVALGVATIGSTAYFHNMSADTKTEQKEGGLTVVEDTSEEAEASIDFSELTSDTKSGTVYVDGTQGTAKTSTSKAASTSKTGKSSNLGNQSFFRKLIEQIKNWFSKPGDGDKPDDGKDDTDKPDSGNTGDQEPGKNDTDKTDSGNTGNQEPGKDDSKDNQDTGKDDSKDDNKDNQDTGKDDQGTGKGANTRSTDGKAEWGQIF